MVNSYESLIMTNVQENKNPVLCSGFHVCNIKKLTDTMVYTAIIKSLL